MLSKLMKSAAVGALLFAIPSANAAVTVVSGPTPGSTTATFTPAPGTNTAVFKFNGYSGNGGPTIVGLTAELALTLTGVVGNSYQFSYILKNTTTLPVSSRLSVFAFNTNPNFQTVSNISGQFDTLASGNRSSGLAPVEFCLKDMGQTNNCNNSSNGSGLLNGQSANGSFWLNFGSAQPSIQLSDFSVRYQSISGAGRVSSAVGVPISGLVPEPATWAMMMLGFGLIGGALRSRKAQATRVTYA